MTIPLRPPAWTVDAACQGLAGPVVDPWNPDDTLPAAKQAELYALARTICATCPVRLACARDALERGEQHGMWGGLTPDERRRIARRHAYPTPGAAQHGTRSRYVAGCTDGPDGRACEACRRAHAAYERSRRAIRREQRRSTTAAAAAMVEPFPWLERPVGHGRWRATPGQYYAPSTPSPPNAPRLTQPVARWSHDRPR